MKGKAEFTEAETAQIRSLLRRKQAADRSTQKSLRQRMRDIGFFISDFTSDQSGFTVYDFDSLVASGAVRVRRSTAEDTIDPARPNVPTRLVHAAPSTRQGHRIVEEWMGRPVETLEDLLRPGLRAVCIGINPSPVSVAAGHYYQGTLGQRLWARLSSAGLITTPTRGAEDDEAIASGIGFTDIVKRPTRSAGGVTPKELGHGRSLLLEKLRSVDPEVVIFVFKQAATTMLGPFRGSGLRPDTLGGSGVFVMPGPYAPRELVASALANLRSAFLGDSP